MLIFTTLIYIKSYNTITQIKEKIMLYAKYQRLFKNNQISTGFSRRLPDYADKYKFDLLEQSINQSNKNIFLDIGAGTGRLSALLINHLFKKGIALEIAPDKKTWTTFQKIIQT